MFAGKYTDNLNTYLQDEITEYNTNTYNAPRVKSAMSVQCNGEYLVRMSSYCSGDGAKGCSGCDNLYIYLGGGSDMPSMRNQISFACRVNDKWMRPTEISNNRPTCYKEMV